MYGGVGGAEPRGSPLSRFRRSAAKHGATADVERMVRCLAQALRRLSTARSASRPTGTETSKPYSACPTRAATGDIMVHSRSSTHLKPVSSPSNSHGWVGPAVLGTAAALGAAALYTAKMTRDAERKHPPIGRFLDVDGVRLHYIERGTGEPLVLIHGNGTLIQDFTVNGLVDRLSERYRIIVFDRPGYGYSDRPRGLWTPRAHATLFEHALAQLGVEQAVVLGHSWGTMVAVSLALQAPTLVRSLVLLSGYYFPTARMDVALNTPLAVPGIGDALRHTISPPLARLMLPAGIRAMFAPAPVPEHFDRLFPKDLMMRPIQLRASMEDAALMTPSVIELEQHYRDLKLPMVILTGGDDQIADVARQSERLHQEIPQSELTVLPGLGHMVHPLAPDAVIKAIDRAAELAGDASQNSVAARRAAGRAYGS